MQTQINAFVETKSGAMAIKIFGYSTKGVPGLEIIGLGKFGQTIKQKFIFISRQRGIKFGAKRYVICVEQNDILRQLDLEDIKWLEFPLLLLLWFMAGIVPIKTLEDCFCSGYIKTDGMVIHHDFTFKIQEYFVQLKEENLKLISVDQKSNENFYLIDSKYLLGDIASLKFA